MKTGISFLFPLLLVSLACIAVVEGGYRIVENILFAEKEERAVVAQIPQKKLSSPALKRAITDDARVILDRNLFGRLPSPESGRPADANLAELQETRLDLVLMGTILDDRAEGRAIILEKAKKTQDIYRQGEMVQGAIVKEILRKKVVLNHNDKDEILDMAEAGKYAAGTPVVAAPAIGMGQVLPNSGSGGAVMRQDQEVIAPEDEEHPEEDEKMQAEAAESAEISEDDQSGEEDDMAEIDPLKPEKSVIEARPEVVRPARRFTIQQPLQPSQ